MRKLFFIMIFAIIAVFSINICSANYYDDNPDYYFVMNVQRCKTYLDLNSIDVQEYDPPRYQIKGRFVNVGGIDKKADEVSDYYIVIRYN